MANNGKGIGPNGLGAGKGSVTSPAKQRAHQKASKKLTLSDLGNKNAEMGGDGKMTIISANMAKNQKMIPLKKLDTRPDMPLAKLVKKKDNKSAKSLANKSGYKG